MICFFVFLYCFIHLYEQKASIDYVLNEPFITMTKRMRKKLLKFFYEFKDTSSIS
jgi:hypothetical protein